MKKENKTPTKPFSTDPRTAYMIAWRDRCIQRLEEELAGREEERALLCTLLYGALMQKSEKMEGGAYKAVIDKAELGDLLGRFRCTVENGEASYTVRFLPQGEATCNGTCEEA